MATRPAGHLLRYGRFIIISFVLADVATFNWPLACERCHLLCSWRLRLGLILEQQVVSELASEFFLSPSDSLLQRQPPAGRRQILAGQRARPAGRLPGSIDNYLAG